MPERSKPGRHGQHKDADAVEDDGCQGTAPVARNEAVAVSTEANAATNNEVKVWGQRRWQCWCWKMSSQGPQGRSRLNGRQPAAPPPLSRSQPTMTAVDAAPPASSFFYSGEAARRNRK